MTKDIFVIPRKNNEEYIIYAPLQNIAFIVTSPK